jgi:23S rRNA pseudouridine2605 synthase
MKARNSKYGDRRHGGRSAAQRDGSNARVGKGKERRGASGVSRSRNESTGRPSSPSRWSEDTGKSSRNQKIKRHSTAPRSHKSSGIAADKRTGGKARDTGGKARDTGGKARDTGGKARDTGGKARDTGGKARDTGGRARDTGGRARDTGGRARDTGGRARDTGGRARDTGGRARDTGGRARDTGPRGQTSAGRNRDSKRDTGVKRKGTPHTRLQKNTGKRHARTGTVAVRPIEEELRLNKFLAEAGVASRRKADELIRDGLVRVNGKIVTELGSRVHPARDEVSVRGTPVYIHAQLYYILLNKPKDCITTTSDERGRRTVMDLVPAEHHVYPVGRLDRNTTGALLLTNDGDLANKLMHPRFNAAKHYIVEVDKKVKSQDITQLRKGVSLEDGMTAPCEAEILDRTQGTVVGLTINEGRNRQVRRMFEALGYDVRKLDRIGYAGLGITGLRRGAWRYLDENEVRALKNLVRKSSRDERRS